MRWWWWWWWCGVGAATVKASRRRRRWMRLSASEWIFFWRRPQVAGVRFAFISHRVSLSLSLSLSFFFCVSFFFFFFFGSVAYGCAATPSAEEASAEEASSWMEYRFVKEVRLLPKDNVIEYFFMGSSNTWKWVPVVELGNEMELILELK